MELNTVHSCNLDGHELSFEAKIIRVNNLPSDENNYSEGKALFPFRL